MSEWGPAGGLPVLFCTGAGMSRLGFGSEHVTELGIRLICIDRPGLGLSDPHPAKTLTSWADDIRQVVSLSELRGPVTVGFSQGAPFAFALAAHGLVGKVAIVSGQDELAHQSNGFPIASGRRENGQNIRSDSAEFEKQFSSFVTADGLWKLIIGVS
jgi:pimeloyl-ACP methyl ester carboxylesterase